MSFESNIINKNSLEDSRLFSLKEVNVLHFLNENKTRLYINEFKDYTIYLEELEDQVIFVESGENGTKKTQLQSKRKRI